MDLQLTPSQDFLAQLEEVTNILQDEVSKLDDTEANFDPGSHMWCVKKIIAHLRDSDGIFNERMQKILNENNPYLAGFNPDALAEKNNYGQENWDEVLPAFIEVRTKNLDFLRSLKPDQLEKSGTQEERGRVTVSDIAESLLEHTNEHLEQVRYACWLSK